MSGIDTFAEEWGLTAGGGDAASAISNQLGGPYFKTLRLTTAECETTLRGFGYSGIFTRDEDKEIPGPNAGIRDNYLWTDAIHPNWFSLDSSAGHEWTRIAEDASETSGISLADIYGVMKGTSSDLAEQGRNTYRALHGSDGGGEGTQPPPPFLAGGPWAATQFQGKTFRLEPVLEAGFLPARRPGVGGAVVEHPHRYATLHVMNIDGKVRFSTTDFSLVAVKKQVGEKFKVISTFDGEHLVFQCDKGKVYQFNFKMLDSSSYDWLRSFELNWNRLFRGTQLAKKQNRLYIMYSSTLVGGYPLAMSVSQSSEQHPMAGMAISMYITDDVPLPTMAVIDRNTGVYQWQGTSYRVGEGVSGRLATNTELPIGSKSGGDVDDIVEENYTPGPLGDAGEGSSI